MTTIAVYPPPTVEELSEAIKKGRAEVAQLRAKRAILDESVPQEPSARAQFFEDRADITRLDTQLAKAEAALVRVEMAQRSARDARAALVRAEGRPERISRIQRFEKALLVCAELAGDGLALDELIQQEADGRGFAPGVWWSQHLIGPDSTLTRWRKQMRDEHWLP
jgi:ParB-like chromosome segregation protein Spo0J